MYSPTIERALRVALAAHAGHLRKGSGEVPYVVHPAHMALMLARWGQEEAVIAAALLHDVVEDAPDWDEGRVRAEFGSRVAGIVAELTEDKSRSWAERKQAAIDAIPRLSAEAAAVKAADKIHNLRSLAAELAAAPDAATVWASFKGGSEATLANATQLVGALERRLDPRIARALRAALEAVLELPATALRT